MIVAARLTLYIYFFKTTREVSKRTAIPDPSDFGYVITVDTKSNAPEGWTAYRITHPDAESDPIDKFRINNRAQFTLLGISYAYNKAIDDRPGRLALRDLILGFWKFTANRNIYDLKEILYLDVEEPTLTTMTPSIYEYMGAKTGVDLTVRSGQTGNEDKAYNALLTQAPFCIGAQKMLTEYGDQFLFDTTIESFQFSFPNKQFNFQINIHSTSNS